MAVPIPAGFRFAGVHCGIKSTAQNRDLTLIVGDQSVTAAGVYTQNRVCAAPVVWDRQRTPSADIRAVVANSGNANACTGQQGWQNTVRTTELVAAACGIQSSQVLVLSTGIIGHQLEMSKISAGINAAARTLSADEPGFVHAAQGILTTDTHAKTTGRVLQLAGGTARIAAMAKGSGMIGPNMATMLAVIMTDAILSPADAQTAVQRAADQSFNCISVDGHTSTNDSVLLLSSGEALPQQLSGSDKDTFQTALDDICVELAKSIVRDGEGATHLVEIDVQGCARREDAVRIAHTIANSPLVKTAIAGGDPNWGRIISAAGYALVPFDPEGVSLSINGCALYEHGTPVEFDAGQVSSVMRSAETVRIGLRFCEGSAAARFWTCDLTADYVRINADYHT